MDDPKIQKDLMEQSFKKTFDECYNTGVDNCISALMNYYDRDHDLINMIATDLEQLKKPLQ